MRRSKAIAGSELAVITAIMAAPLAAQSELSPAQLSVGPQWHHIHEGEIGEKLLVVEQAIKCGCGTCAMDLHTCQFQMECGTSPVWSQRILASLQAGETPEAIEASFVADFGGSVLLTPPAEGFNLVGYFLPSVAIVAAGMLIGLLVRGGATRAHTAPVRELGEEEAEKLRDALRRLDEAEGPDW